MMRKANHEPIKPSFKLKQTLLKISKRVVKRPPMITLIMMIQIAILRL